MAGLAQKRWNLCQAWVVSPLKSLYSVLRQSMAIGQKPRAFRVSSRLVAKSKKSPG